MIGVAVVCVLGGICRAADVGLDVIGYDPACGVSIEQRDDCVHVSWPLGDGGGGRMIFDLAMGRPLIHEIAVTPDADGEPAAMATGLDPVIRLRVGNRDLARRDGWTIFFDRMQRKPHETFEAEWQITEASAVSRHRRATLTLGEVTAGPFRGLWRWTFFADHAFVLQEAVLTTHRDPVAYLYDAGLVYRDEPPEQIAWNDTAGSLHVEPVGAFESVRHLAVRGRAVSAKLDGGSLALFPPPHRYFYPLDFSTNLKNVWAGRTEQEPNLGFGIRHDPAGDDRFVPWFNAPPGTAQEMGMFLLLSPGSPEQALAAAAQLTRDDRFARLPEHAVFTSHYHVEHTEEMRRAQQRGGSAGDSTGRLPSGGEYRIPERLENPGFVRVMRDMGIDIAHLAEFHFGHTPKMKTVDRLARLELLHAECQRLSDERFLLVPGEEPNVHLGGHWISLFPHPVYWVLNRPEGTPWVTKHPALGPVFHVGSEADVLRLLQAQGGLAWTAHPRIKGSTGFPDGYRRRPFFESDRFLGGAWKAMPADLSRPRLGERVLDLLDDMSNWGAAKYVPGEVDVFQIEPDHELYGHMNVNYLRLDALPRFEGGWQSVLDALQSGAFFVTTGEVLIPDFTVDGRRSGERVFIVSDTLAINVDLSWTFPLAFAEIVSGDGRDVRRTRIDLGHTPAFGSETFTWHVNLTGQRWVRLAVWDVATNGAFTQPVWLEE
ncbi:MAG: hypothetical protein DWQ37_09310 [Planctomycetota bacterium]|nr:MAG: hypothetical protein DWQ37_09310 [Planctomycetota bacterium]